MSLIHDECNVNIISVHDVMSGIYFVILFVCVVCFFFFQAEDGIRDLVRSRGLGDVYKRQAYHLHNK